MVCTKRSTRDSTNLFGRWLRDRRLIWPPRTVHAKGLAEQTLLDRFTSALSAPGHPRELLERAALVLLDYIEEDTDGFRVLTRDAPVNCAEVDPWSAPEGPMRQGSASLGLRGLIPLPCLPAAR